MTDAGLSGRGVVGFFRFRRGFKKELQNGGQEEDCRSQDAEAADRRQHSEAENSLVRRYAETAKSHRRREAGEDNPHGRIEGKDDACLVLLLLTPAMQDDNAVFYPRPNDERHEETVGQIQIDPEQIHQPQGP